MRIIGGTARGNLRAAFAALLPCARRTTTLEGFRLNTVAAGKAAEQGAKTAFSILAAISFCHLLNDMMQSLLPAIYPILKANYGSRFRPDWVLRFTFQADRVVAAARDRLLHRPSAEAVLARRWHGLLAPRPFVAVACEELRRACCSPPRSWAPARPCSTRNPRASRGWRPASSRG